LLLVERLLVPTMWPLPWPLSEGKSAKGKVEMIQLYHRIRVVPEG
jgi:hypothetical protein